MSEHPQLTNVELISSGWLNKYVLTYTLPNGRVFTYECVSRKKLEAFKAELEGNATGKTPTPDAVCIVPFLPNGDLVLIREFRFPINTWCIAFPAGLLEPGEDLLTAIDRELHEEVGCRVRTELGEQAIRVFPQTGYSSVGMSEESVQIVLAQVDFDGEAEPEPTEFIESFVLKREDIAAFLRDNTDAIGTRGQVILELARYAAPEELFTR